jgi:hypothetical protein
MKKRIAELLEMLWRGLVIVQLVVPALGVGFVIWYIWGRWGAKAFLSLLTLGIADTEISTLMTRLGQTGDLFGGINALFAAFAFAGVAYATFLQQRTLAATREQGRQQSFESLFFHLLTMHNTAVENVFFRTPESWGRGGGDYKISLFADFANHRLGTLWNDMLREGGGLNPNTNQPNDLLRQRRQFTQVYQELYAAKKDAVGPFFRSFYHLFKLIDESILPDEEKLSYTQIVLATQGPGVLALLALFCMDDRGQAFSDLVKKYDLLSQLRDERTETPGAVDLILEWHFPKMPPQ